VASAGGAPPDLPAAAAAVVAGLTGSAVRSSERIHRGMMNFKCRVRTASGDDLMVRFYPAGRAHLVLQEPDLLARCGQAGLPVPATLCDSRTGPPAPLSYVVYRRIEGETLADRLATLDDERRRRLAADLAHHLERLERVRFEGAGDLETGSIARAASWSAFVSASMRDGLDAIRRHAVLEPALADALERAVGRGPPAPMREPRKLVWGDINFENILVADDGTVAGLIDFEGCLSGDPLATLGYCGAVHGRDPFFRSLVGAWPRALTAAEGQLVAWYALLRALRLARYVHLALPTGRPRDPLIRIVPGILEALAALAAIDRPQTHERRTP